jgi:hypothetical protein
MVSADTPQSRRRVVQPVVDPAFSFAFMSAGRKLPAVPPVHDRSIQSPPCRRCRAHQFHLWCLHDRPPSSPRARSSSTRPTPRPPCRRAPAVADAALEGACPVQCRRRRRVRWVAYDNREGRLCPPQVAGERRSSSVLARALLGLRWTGPGPINRFKLKIVQF